MNLKWKGLSALDKFRQSLVIFYLKELSLADEREEFLRLFDSNTEKMLHSLLSFSDSNREDIIQILDYNNHLKNDLKVA